MGFEMGRGIKRFFWKLASFIYLCFANEKLNR